jgi:hypothetical protein
MLCSLQFWHRPIIASQLGHGNVVDPRFNKPFPQEMHLSDFSMFLAEY